MARDYKVGDVVFWSFRGSAEGEAMVIGRLKADPAALVVALGDDFSEIDEAHCTWTGTGRPAEGAAHRRAYLKQNPGALK